MAVLEVVAPRKMNPTQKILTHRMDTHASLELLWNEKKFERRMKRLYGLGVPRDGAVT